MNREKRFLIAAAFVIVLATALPASAEESPAEEGKRIFEKVCKSCHRLTEGMLVGPGLAGVTKRRSEEWIDKWLSGPKAVLASKDPDAVELKSRFKMVMPTLEPMKDPASRKAIIEFLKENDAKN